VGRTAILDCPRSTDTVAGVGEGSSCTGFLVTALLSSVFSGALDLECTGAGCGDGADAIGSDTGAAAAFPVADVEGAALCACA
jgi:hypothetical protein